MSWSNEMEGTLILRGENNRQVDPLSEDVDRGVDGGNIDEYAQDKRGDIEVAAVSGGRLLFSRRAFYCVEYRQGTASFIVAHTNSRLQE